MKFRCEREALAEALVTAGRAASGRSGAMPAITGLRLELVGDQLTVTATDLDLTIQVVIAVGGDRDGHLRRRRRRWHLRRRWRLRRWTWGRRRVLHQAVSDKIARSLFIQSQHRSQGIHRVGIAPWDTDLRSHVI